MPKWLTSLQAKIEEARISDLNYELGKWTQETKAYVTNLKSGFRRPTANVPKSASVPVLSFYQSNNQTKTNDVNHRYHYKSSTLSTCEEEGHGELVDEELKSTIPDSTVVEKFIKVVEASSGAAPNFKSREEIRKKLAFGAPDEPEESKRTNCGPNDLEVCFINEVTEDLISDQKDVQHSSLTRSKTFSEYASISSRQEPENSSAYTQVACRLAECKDIARRKILIEQRNRKFHQINTISRLIGKSIESRLSDEILSQMNTPTLQVIVNDFHSKIEALNEELVHELMQKDELQVKKKRQTLG